MLVVGYYNDRIGMRRKLFFRVDAGSKLRSLSPGRRVTKTATKKNIREDGGTSQD
jgi:hypothetical protein